MHVLSSGCFQGGVSYHDFSGHKGTINEGDVQVRSPIHSSIERTGLY